MVMFLRSKVKRVGTRKKLASTTKKKAVQQPVDIVCTNSKEKELDSQPCGVFLLEADLKSAIQAMDDVLSSQSLIEVLTEDLAERLILVKKRLVKSLIHLKVSSKSQLKGCNK